MNKVIKVIVIGKHEVWVRSMRHSANAKAEYCVEIYYIRDGFGLNPYHAQVGYCQDTLKTKAQAFNVAKSIANGQGKYKGFMYGGAHTIPHEAC